MKICLVCSSGGHLYQLHMLKDWWQEHDRFWVTFRKADALSLLKNEKTHWAFFPTTRNIWNLLRNTILAFKILRREKPDLIISDGAGVAVPFFYIGRLLGVKLVFIEVYDRIESPTLTGKLVHPVSHLFICQCEEQIKHFRKGRFWGQIL